MTDIIFRSQFFNGHRKKNLAEQKLKETNLKNVRVCLGFYEIVKNHFEEFVITSGPLYETVAFIIEIVTRSIRVHACSNLSLHAHTWGLNISTH